MRRNSLNKRKIWTSKIVRCIKNSGKNSNIKVLSVLTFCILVLLTQVIIFLRSIFAPQPTDLYIASPTFFFTLCAAWMFIVIHVVFFSLSFYIEMNFSKVKIAIEYAYLMFGIVGIISSFSGMTDLDKYYISYFGNEEDIA